MRVNRRGTRVLATNSETWECGIIVMQAVRLAPAELRLNPSSSPRRWGQKFVTESGLAAEPPRCPCSAHVMSVTITESCPIRHKILASLICKKNKNLRSAVPCLLRHNPFPISIFSFPSTLIISCDYVSLQLPTWLRRYYIKSRG
jgi:hypothetical protein